jgi:hypothetical protein
VGATLDETRLELEAQRARVRGTADRLEAATRRSLDIKAVIGRNPGKTIGLAAGAAFFLLGGPRRTVRFVSRSLRRPASGEKAYAALPASLRAFVDDTAPGFGDAKTRAKEDLALALHAWRQDPKNRKKADKLVSETLTPPGPERAFWALVEVAGVTAAGVIAKQIVGRQLAGGAFRSIFGSRPGAGVTDTKAAPQATPAPTTNGKPRAASPAGPGTSPAPGSGKRTADGEVGYSGWSGGQTPSPLPPTPAAPEPGTPAPSPAEPTRR